MTARESLEFPESHPLLRDGAAAGGLPRALAGTGQGDPCAAVIRAPGSRCCPLPAARHVARSRRGGRM